MKVKDMILVDGDRLLAAVTEHGYRVSSLSEDMGFNPGYISNCANRGRITKSGAKLLEGYGIMLSEYQHIEPEPEPLPWDFVEPEPPAMIVRLDDVSIEKLGNMIYERVKKAWSE